MRTQWLIGLTFALPVLAQNTVVSPVGATTVEGAASNNFPFASSAPRRYQQLHGDLGPGAKLITQLSFRSNSGTTDNTGTRVLDLELYLGEGVPALRPSFTFDANYLPGGSGRTLAIPRSNIVFGPQGQAVVGINPFTGNMDLVLTTPFFYSGNGSLVWEVAYHGSTPGATGPFGPLDAEQGVVTLGNSQVIGAGCVPTGGTNPMAHTYNVIDVAGTLVLNAQVTNGPPNSFCLLGVGTFSPFATIPGLCGTVFTDAQLQSVIGITDANGAISAQRPSFATASLPNGIAGLQLFSQVFALDFASTQALPLVPSDGRSVVVPASDLSRVNACSRILNLTGGATATEGEFFSNAIGYALVTRFTYF